MKTPRIRFVDNEAHCFCQTKFQKSLLLEFNIRLHYTTTHPELIPGEQETSKYFTKNPSQCKICEKRIFPQGADAQKFHLLTYHSQKLLSPTKSYAQLIKGKGK